MPIDSAASGDPLLAALLWLTRHHGRPYSAASLLAGMPLLDGPLSPPQALRVLQNAGFKAGVVERPLPHLDALLFPLVLLLHGRGACIVHKRLDDGRYEVIDPASGTALVLPEAELVERYSGFALLASPQPVPHVPEAARDTPHWLWGTLRRFLPYYRTAILAALLSNVLTMASGLIMSVAFDKVIPHQAFATLWALAAVGFTALAFDTAARQLRCYFIDMAGKKADLLVGMTLFRQTLDVRMEHRPESAGACAYQVAQIELVRDFSASATLSALTDVPFVLLFVAMIFVVAGPLGWVMVAAIPLVLGGTVLMQRSLRRTTRMNMLHLSDQQALMVEALEGLEDVKAVGAQGRFVGKYEQSTAAGVEVGLRMRRATSWSNNLSSAAQQLVTLVMLVWGVYLIADNQLSSGGLIGAVMFAGRALAPLSSLVSLGTRYQSAQAALRALNGLMAQPTEHRAGAPVRPPVAISGNIALRDVQFSYPTTTTATVAAPLVLRGINLRFTPGERVAILGRIGSGKSTVLRVLAGLYQPQQGRVEVDGIDLRQLDTADFRSQIGFVSQEPRLFKGTLRENVTMGRPGIDATALAEVAQLTGLDRVVAGHPQGWELEVGEAGALLSGGQRQLVALARSLVTRPRILLMDEPTSSMDAQSEQLFLRHLTNAAGNCTLVMVTHRPAVLELVQRVVVIDAGQVLLDGPKPLVLAALAGQRNSAPGTAVQPVGSPTPAPAVAAVPSSPAAVAAQT